MALDRDSLAAATHLDGTARVQTVARSGEPFLHTLLERFARETGVAAVLNTSFDDQEPIVETPKDAVACFLGTDIDVLYWRRCG